MVDDFVISRQGSRFKVQRLRIEALRLRDEEAPGVLALSKGAAFSRMSIEQG
jgi:hypothetical protein